MFLSSVDLPGSIELDESVTILTDLLLEVILRQCEEFSNRGRDEE